MIIKFLQDKFQSKKLRFLLLTSLIFLPFLGTVSELDAIWNREISGSPQNYEVVLLKDGFSPSILQITRGSTVTFRSETGQVFWPASNFHPTHEIYSEFDPKKPLGPSDSWSFTFNETGSWRYHNHLSPSIFGTIVVGNTLAERVFGFNDPCRGGKFQDTAKNRNLQIRCWQKELDETLQKDGLDKAFQVFNKLYKEELGFSSACHDMTHLLGEASYHEFTKTSKVQHSNQTVNCSYGFYHGFIEAMLHSGQGYEKVINYCQKVQDILIATISSPSVFTQCFHGIGHGTFDTLNSTMWGDGEAMVNKSLDTCEKFSGDDKLLFSCAKGVFNALINAYAYGNYNLTLDQGDPLALCNKQSNEWYRLACFVDLTIYYTHQAKLELPDAIRFITLGIPDEQVRAEVIMAQVNQVVQHSEGKILMSTFIDTCVLFSGIVRERCLIGIIEGIFLSGNPENMYLSAISLCRSTGLTMSDRKNCYGHLASKLFDTFPREKASMICRNFETSYEACK